MPVNLTSHLHDHQGVAHGEFAEYIDRCRQTSATTDCPKITFRSIEYHNHGSDRSCPLFACELIACRIRGLYLDRHWSNVQFRRTDVAHSSGTSIWRNVHFHRCNLRSLHGTVHASNCSFVASPFNNSNLTNSVFVSCAFVKCSLGAAFSQAQFHDCMFEDVDLTGSIWRQPVELGISGTWFAKDQLRFTTDPMARSFFKVLHVLRPDA